MLSSISHSTQALKQDAKLSGVKSSTVVSREAWSPAQVGSQKSGKPEPAVRTNKVSCFCWSKKSKLTAIVEMRPDVAASGTGIPVRQEKHQPVALNPLVINQFLTTAEAVLAESRMALAHAESASRQGSSCFSNEHDMSVCHLGDSCVRRSVSKAHSRMNQLEAKHRKLVGDTAHKL